MDQYRFDDAYESVYVYDDEAKCYLHVGTYLAYGIDKKMSETEKLKIVEDMQQ